MDLVEYYYENKYGIYPFENNEPKIRTEKTINYLKEIGYKEKEIVLIIERSEKAEALEYKNLPDDLWNESLLKKNRYYFHERLQIKSEPPKLNLKDLTFKTETFYIEMIIRFTIEDALNYFYNKCHINPFMQNIKRDIGAIQHLLIEYKHIDFIEPIDFLLNLIDYASKETNCSYKTLLELDNQYRGELMQQLETKIINAKAMGLNKIIFR